jgi:carbamoyltransferase
MIILGLKITHDGAVALIDNGRLIFSHEMEKIDNSPRFSELRLSFQEIVEIISSYGYRYQDIDRIVIDGWGLDKNNLPEKYIVPVDIGFGKINLEFAEYGVYVKDENMLKSKRFELKPQRFSYSSYSHISGHIFSSYCTSPFSRKGKSSFILVWDGPTPPQLFYFDYESTSVKNLGILFPILGLGYTSMGINYEPFSYAKKESYDPYDISAVAGKIMAYIALGEDRQDILAKFHEIYTSYTEGLNQYFPTSHDLYLFSKILLSEFIDYGKSIEGIPADMMKAYHMFIRDLLLKGLENKIGEYPGYERNLCFSGGCALNIKWNSAIRDSGIFMDMWVQPFPNDSGSAVGTACCEMVQVTGKKSLDWHVYQGPPLTERELATSDWSQKVFSIKELAALLHNISLPVVVLNNHAELGPRALGNRSILASAQDYAMKDLLNEVKSREDYRPVAPICIEEDAPNIFTPGHPDPYMLFDHQLKSQWKEKVPAVCHIDGTSRLQTINRKQNPEVYELLCQYKALSGIPLLCNTSANFKGKGFFPDIKSAQEWGRLNYIWSKGMLYWK